MEVTYVVGFVGVLRTRRSDGGARGGLEGAVRDLEHGRVHLLQRIDALLELNVVRRELSLLCPLSMPSLYSLRGSGGNRTLSSTVPTCSLTYCALLAAQGVKEAL
jgi:hypothetical protein